jgi:hypothetical protein
LTAQGQYGRNLLGLARQREPNFGPGAIGMGTEIMPNEKTTATPDTNAEAPKDKKNMTRAELEEVVAMAELRAREAEAAVRLTEANAKLRKLKSEKKTLRPDF